jgi:hypothetical protein
MEETMVKMRLVHVFGALALVASCGKGSDKAEAPKDPAQAALAQFKDFVSKTYPATSFKTADQQRPVTCEITKIDVLKSDSVSSPYTGSLEAKGLMGRIPGGDTANAFGGIYKLTFTNDGSGWKCDQSKSSGAVQEEGFDAKPMNGEWACTSIDHFCLGKDATK